MTRGVRHSTGPPAWAARFTALIAASAWCASHSQDFAGETIVFGGDLAYPPFEWLTDDGPVGFDIDLEDAIAVTGRAKPIHRLTDWPDAVRSLESGNIDVLAMFRSEQREQSFLFTPPFHFVNHGIYAKEDVANVTSLDELAGNRIVVEELSYAHQQLVTDTFPAEYVLETNTLTALEAIAEDRADYAVLAAATSTYLIRDHALPLRNVGPPLWPREYAFAVRKDRPELSRRLTEQYYTILRNGVYQNIFADWERDLAPIEEHASARILKLLSVPGLILAVAGLGWAWRLRRVVVARTRGWKAEIDRRRSAEADARWARGHDDQTALLRLHSFSERVNQLLSGAGSSSHEKHQIIALKLADLDRTVRTLGHESAQESMREFAQTIRSLRFPACGQTGRDVFLVFGEAVNWSRLACSAV